MRCTLILKSEMPNEHGRYTYACSACGRVRTHRRCDARLSARCGKQLPAPSYGPGSELKALIAELGIVDDGCGRCAATAKEMNRLGVDGVRRLRAHFAERLRTAANRRGIPAKLLAAAGSITSGLAWRLSPLDVYGSLVDEACRRAAGVAVQLAA